MKCESGVIEQIHLSFLLLSNRFRLEGEDRQGHGIDLSLSLTAMQSLMRQNELSRRLATPRRGFPG